MSKVKAIGQTLRRKLSKLHPEYRALGSASAPPSTTTDAHLRTAMDWLREAHDATPDDGVARSYALLYNPYFGGRGWMSSYPETTGYIIPTFYDYAALTGESDFADRARRMAAWESEVQLESGAVQGGVIGQKATPAVFNTGQVIFGWVRAYQETGDEAFLDSAVRAGRFLVESMSDDGAWHKGLSDYAGDGKMTFRVYNVRCAWALAQLGAATSDASFTDAARRAGLFALKEQQENGWFPSNCLYNPALPHLHTIAYAARGVLETGILLEMDELIDSGKRASDGVLTGMESDGFISDRFDKEWAPADEHSCLTGNAQIALCWGRLYELNGDDKYLEGLGRASQYLRSRQIWAPEHPAIHGGVSGSWPLEARYGPYELLNWAAKFFADMLMMEKRLSPDSE